MPQLITQLKSRTRSRADLRPRLSSTPATAHAANSSTPPPDASGGPPSERAATGAEPPAPAILPASPGSKPRGLPKLPRPLCHATAWAFAASLTVSLAVTLGAVVLFGAPAGVGVGAVAAALLVLYLLIRTRIDVTAFEGVHQVRASGQLTALAAPRLSRALAALPAGSEVSVRLDGAFVGRAAFEALRSWADAHRSDGGWVTFGGPGGRHFAEPEATHGNRRWTPWPAHLRTSDISTQAPASSSADRLLVGTSTFQRDTAPLVRPELARLAREGQRPRQLFLTCADSHVVTSMITSSGPGDLFTVRIIGNLVPPSGADASCDAVAAAVEYAVDVLGVGSITVCGHSGCGAMEALLSSSGTPGAQTPLARWLRHGRPSLARSERIGRLGRGEVAMTERPVADELERLALVNVMQQLDHLMAHPCVTRGVAEGSLTLQGLYFHVEEAQTYVLDATSGTFSAVRPEVSPVSV